MIWPHFAWEPPRNWKPVLGWTEPPADRVALGRWAVADYERCERDPYYFISNYGRVQNNDGAWEQFLLWDSQRPVLEALNTQRLLAILKARQLGMTKLCLHKQVHTGLFRGGSTQLLFSLRDLDAVENLTRLKLVYKGLPPHLKCSRITKESDHEYHLSNGSIWKAFPTGAGDSYTAACALIDEADLVPDLDDLLSRVKPTIDGGGALWLVSRADKLHAKGTESAFKRIFQAAREGKSNYKAIFLPWHARPDRDLTWYDNQVKDALPTERGIDFVHEQYPLTPEEALAPAQSNKRLPIGVLGPCCQISPPLPQEAYGTAVSRFQEHCPDIPCLRVYGLPGARRVVIGADPAEGNPTSCDSGAVALDADTGEQLASLQGKVEPAVLAVYLDRLALWYNRATLNVERNNHGHAVLLWLEENSNAYVMAGPDDRKGWLSNAKGKALMYDLCADALRDKRVTIHDQTCFNQLASIVGGTLKPPETMPGDMAVSFALAAAAMERLAPQEWVAPTKLVQPQATPVAQLKAAARAGVFGIGQSGRRGPFG